MSYTVIMGAGLAGTNTAITLADRFRKDTEDSHMVVLIESGSEVLPEESSSMNQCNKFHLGMHYLGDPKTAELCLLKSIEFARAFPDFIAGGNDLKSPWRRGRHYIMANSLTSAEEAKKIALRLQALYKTKVDEDSQNEVFGKPEDFIRFLSHDELPVAANIPYYNADGEWEETQVVLGIETAESQMDIDSLRAHLQKQIEEHPNIIFKPNTRVSYIEHTEDELGYRITLDSADARTVIDAEAVVNCAWQNIEKINKELGFNKEDYINRAKVSVVIDLPSPLKKMNTSLFSSGAYGSITVLPNGQAILTSERLTNIGYYLAGTEPSPELRDRMTKMTLDHPEGKALAEQIRNDCAHYFSEEIKELFLNAPIKALRLGFVKLRDETASYTQKALYQANNTVHTRLADGVQEHSFNYLSNAGMKAIYTVSNANKVSDLLKEHNLLKNEMNKIKSKLIEDLSLPEDDKQNLNRLLNTTYKATLYNLSKQKRASITQGICLLSNLLFRKFKSENILPPHSPSA